MREPLIFRNWRIHPSALMLMILAVIYKYCVKFFLLKFDIENRYCDNISSGYCQLRRSGGYLWFRVWAAAGGIIQDLSYYTKSILFSLQPHFTWPCRRGSWRRTSFSVLEEAGLVLNAHKNLGESPRPSRWLRSLQRRTRLVGGLPRMGQQWWQINNWTRNAHSYQGE